MTRRRPGPRAGPARPRGDARAKAARPPRPALPLRHPAALLALAACAALVVLAVTFDAHDPDQWGHLAVGRWIWAHARVPATEQWTWPTWGQPVVDYAWGFEALLWPVWKLGGVAGLYAWRWLTTLAVFALAFVAARRMGARGLLAPLASLAACAMLYRARSQARPETIAAVLLAAEVALLEARRHGARVHLAWLLPLACVWANTHLSWYLGLAVLGAHALAASWPGRAPGAPAARPLWFALAACCLVLLVNPYGWRTLWEPLRHAFTLRQTLIYRTVDELQPVEWAANVRNGLVVVVGLWPLLALARAWRAGLDVAEVLTCAAFTASLWLGQRFVGPYAVVAAPYLARDLDEWVATLPHPRAGAAPWARAGAAVLACALVAWPEMTRPEAPVRMRVPANLLPVGAADFLRAQGLHGRMFNPFGYGGYLAFAAGPRRDQQPFMSLHMEGSPALTDLYVRALVDARAWRDLQAAYGIDYVVAPRLDLGEDSLLVFLDRDPVWARVFGDDGAYVFVRRDGPFARLAADSAYTRVPADPVALALLARRFPDDDWDRAAIERELVREVAGSPHHAAALALLARLAMWEGRGDDAERELLAALRIDPVSPNVREKLGVIALARGRPREALRWFEAERRVLDYRDGLEFRRGQVAEAEGDLPRALACWRRELERDPDNGVVRDSVAALSARLGR